MTLDRFYWWPLSFAPRWLLARWGRQALEDHYGVPYLKEINRHEHYGLLELERRGEAHRDEVCFGGLHWHRVQR